MFNFSSVYFKNENSHFCSLKICWNFSANFYQLFESGSKCSVCFGCDGIRPRLRRINGKFREQVVLQNRLFLAVGFVGHDSRDFPWNWTTFSRCYKFQLRGKSKFSQVSSHFSSFRKFDYLLEAWDTTTWNWNTVVIIKW